MPGARRILRGHEKVLILVFFETMRKDEYNNEYIIMHPVEILSVFIPMRS